MGGGDRHRGDKSEYDDRSYFPPTDYQQEEREFAGNMRSDIDIENELGAEEEEGPEGEDEDMTYDSLFQGNGQCFKC